MKMDITRIIITLGIKPIHIGLFFILTQGIIIAQNDKPNIIIIISDDLK